MSTKLPTVAEIEAKARAGELRDLKSSHTITLPNGEQHGYTIQTESNDPAEIAAFQRLETDKQAALHNVVQRYRERPIELPSETLEFQRREAEEMARYKAQLATERTAAQRPAAPDKPFDPENRLSNRWNEYKAQATGASWSSVRGPKANERMFQLFLTSWGKDGDIATITREDINKFIKFLLTEKKVEAGDRLGDDGLGHRSVDNHVGVISGLLKWARDKGYFPDEKRLPTEKQTLFSKKARKAASGKANPTHTIGQLKTLFDPQNFRPNEAHHFWPPLISLFTGARRREVAQLLLSDFFLKDGIHAMSINILEDEDKSVKSAAAIRMIPVHPELIALGLLEYLRDVKALGLGPEVFPGIGVNANGEKGNAIGNFWRGHMKKAGLFSARSPTFHSFRSTALQELKDRGVEWEMRCQLAGHEIDHVSEGYNPNKFSLKRLKKDGIPKLRYEGLELSALKYQTGRFDSANKNATKARIKREQAIERKQRMTEEKEKRATSFAGKK